jgi:DNA-binding PadR family transcriptional regulator
MYKDHSLIPAEATRLASLGILAEGARRYADLAAEVRQFTGRIVGPSLDLLGPPLEVLRIEGLVVAKTDGDNLADPILALTDKGRSELIRLLGANIRGPLGEFNKLVIALKLRFLGFLTTSEQKGQLELLQEACERELARLTDLRSRCDGMPAALVDWLDHDIEQIEARRRWFADRTTTIEQG